MTKVDIISGFLGAGKTTLIKKLIGEVFEGQKIVLIENEFGEIGIDGGFLKDAGINITEMNSGCICCSLVGDFGKALKEVTEQFTPDRIIIEPSGVGKLSDVRKAVEDAAQDAGLELNSLTTVADAAKIKMYMKNFGEFYNNQIESASTIILSRTQKLSEEKQLRAVEMIREKNPSAVVITTPWDDITGQQILAVMEKGNTLVQVMEESDFHGHHDHDHEEACGCGHAHEHHHHVEECSCGHDHKHHDHDHEEECSCGQDHKHHDHDHEEECSCGHDHKHHDHDHEEECSCGHDHEHHNHDHGEECSCGHHHHADEVFTSWGKETPRKYTREEVEHILQELSHTEEYGMVLRAKGMLPCADGTWIHFDFVPEEYEIRSGSADYTGRLCVIGSRMKEDRLAELFCL